MEHYIHGYLFCWRGFALSHTTFCLVGGGSIWYLSGHGQLGNGFTYYKDAVSLESYL